MTQAIPSSPPPATGTILTASDIVRLSLVQLNGASPRTVLSGGTLAATLQGASALPGEQRVAGLGVLQGTSPSGTPTGPAGGETSGLRSSSRALAQELPASAARPDLASRLQAVNGRPAAASVLVESRSPQAALILQSHGTIAELLRTDVILQIADRSYKNIDGRLSRMQGVARRAASSGLSAEARAVLNQTFDQLRQEVVLLASVASPGTDALVLYTAGELDSELPVFSLADGGNGGARPADPSRPGVASAVVTLSDAVAELIVADISRPATATAAGPAIVAIREKIGEIQGTVIQRQAEIGTQLSQEILAVIALSLPRDDSANALPAAQLSSSVAEKMLAPPGAWQNSLAVPVSARSGDTSGAMPSGQPGAAPSVGRSAANPSIVGGAMGNGDASRSGLVALLSPDPRTLEDPGSPALRNMAQGAERPGGLPGQLAAAPPDILFGLVPGLPGRARDLKRLPRKPPAKRRPGQQPKDDGPAH